MIYLFIQLLFKSLVHSELTPLILIANIDDNTDRDNIIPQNLFERVRIFKSIEGI